MFIQLVHNDQDKQLCINCYVHPIKTNKLPTMPQFIISQQVGWQL
jgi:hypothetical protein